MDFLYYLERYIQQNNIPLCYPLTATTCFPVYKQLVLVLPFMEEVASESRQDIIRATKETEETRTEKGGMKQIVRAETSTALVRTGPSDASKGNLHGK